MLWKKIDRLFSMTKLAKKKTPKVSGAGRRPFRPGMECLETRELLSTTLPDFLLQNATGISVVNDAHGDFVSAHFDTVKLGGFTLSNDTVTPSDSGVTFEGDTSFPVAGTVHLKGSIQDASHYSLSRHLDSISLGGFTLSNDTVTLSDSGVTFEGDATLPLVGTVNQLKGPIQDASHYSLSRHLDSVKFGGFTLSNDTVTLSDSGVTFEGDATLPLVGDVHHLKGPIQDASHYSFTAPLPSLPSLKKIAGFSVSNSQVTLSDSGVKLEADADLPANFPLIHHVHFAGAVSGSDSYDISFTTHDPISLFNGLVTVDTLELHLTPSALKVHAHAKAAQIIDVNMDASFADDGSYSLKGNANITVGGFTLKGADLTLGSDELDIKGSVPVPGIGIVDFTGSYGSGGKWSLTGTYPETILVGGFPVHDWTFGLSNDSLTLGAKIGFNGLVDVGVIGTIFYNGDYKLDVRADVLSLGGFSLGTVDIKLGNVNPDHMFRMDVHAVVGIPSMLTVKLDGYYKANGDYDFTGTTDSVAGLTLAKANFELNNTKGFSFEADLNYFFVGAHIRGTIEKNGHAHFEGDGKLTIFNQDTLHAVVDLDPSQKTYLIDVTARTNVFIATVDFTAHVVKGAQGWPQPTLKGSAQLGGVLSSIVSGHADFTMDANGVSVQNAVVGIPSGPNVTLDGYVKSNGDYDLKGTQTVSVAGLTLSTAHFEVSKTNGFSFDADWNYSLVTAHVKGTIAKDGHVHFEGDGQAAKLANFNLGNVHAIVDLDASKNKYHIDVTASADVFIGTGTFKGYVDKGAQEWPQPTLTVSAQVGGALSKLLSGSAVFTMNATGVTFEGDLSIPRVSGSFHVKGMVYSDGRIQIGGITTSASSITVADAARILNGLGAGVGDIAKALYNGVTTDLGQIAGALSSVSNSVFNVVGALSSVVNDVRQVTKAVWNHWENTVTWNVNDLAGGLWRNWKSTVTWSVNDLAGALSSVNNSVFNVVGALSSVVNDPVQVAKSVWNHWENSVNWDAGNLVNVLISAFGLSSTNAWKIVLGL